jgi:hypothetical protein
MVAEREDETRRRTRAAACVELHADRDESAAAAAAHDALDRAADALMAAVLAAAGFHRHDLRPLGKTPCPHRRTIRRRPRRTATSTRSSAACSRRWGRTTTARRRRFTSCVGSIPSCGRKLVGWNTAPSRAGRRSSPWDRRTGARFSAITLTASSAAAKRYTRTAARSWKRC